MERKSSIKEKPKFYKHVLIFARSLQNNAYIKWKKFYKGIKYK